MLKRRKKWSNRKYIPFQWLFQLERGLTRPKYLEMCLRTLALLQYSKRNWNLHTSFFKNPPEVTKHGLNQSFVKLLNSKFTSFVKITTITFILTNSFTKCDKISSSTFIWELRVLTFHFIFNLKSSIHNRWTKKQEPSNPLCFWRLWFCHLNKSTNWCFIGKSYEVVN